MIREFWSKGHELTYPKKNSLPSKQSGENMKKNYTRRFKPWPFDPQTLEVT